MATITHGNWSFQDPEFEDDRTGTHVSDGDTIEGGNFSQHTPGTEIMKGYASLTIQGGNWTNVKPQPGWTKRGGYPQMERCSHVHPGWVTHGLTVCKDDCAHRRAVKEWTEVNVDEFREAKASMSANHVKIEEQPDADGVRDPRYLKRVYTYADKGI